MNAPPDPVRTVQPSEDGLPSVSPKAGPQAAAPAPQPKSTGDEERRKLTGRAGIVAAGTLFSRILGLLRDLVIAAAFPAKTTDAFFVAFTIPNVLRQLLAEGAVQNAALPVLEATKEKEGDPSARRAYASLRGLSLLVLTLVTILGIVFAPELVELFATGYHRHEGQFERTVTLTRWLFPYIFFMGTAALGMAALNLHRRFVVTSFAPGLLNLAFIACSFALPGWLLATGRDPVLALAIGALLGGVLQVIAQWPSLRRIGYLTLPRLDFRNPKVLQVLRRMGPVLIGIGIYYLDVVLARRFLSELEVGSQSYFGWALRLCDFPQGIFVMALQTATLPSLSRLVARGEIEEVERTFSFALRLTLFVGVTASVAAVVLAEPLTVLIFQRGHFDATSSHETARALAAQGLGIWMVAVVRQLVAVYYAFGDTRSPVRVAATDSRRLRGAGVDPSWPLWTRRHQPRRDRSEPGSNAPFGRWTATSTTDLSPSSSAELLRQDPRRIWGSRRLGLRLGIGMWAIAWLRFEAASRSLYLDCYRSSPSPAPSSCSPWLFEAKNFAYSRVCCDEGKTASRAPEGPHHFRPARGRFRSLDGTAASPNSRRRVRPVFHSCVNWIRASCGRRSTAVRNA
ncbi:MAG: murein biosynthesis integral membrane protein MurJ [Polyangiaceae bacterium]